MKHNLSVSNKIAKRLLDQSAKDLSDRHSQRLEQMTTNAVSSYLENQRLDNQSVINQDSNNHRLDKHRNYFWHISIPLAAVSSILLALFLWLPGVGRQPTVDMQNNPTVAKVPSSDLSVPGWVMDTSVPISLLKNQAFYDWMAKQKEGSNHG